MTLEFEEGLAGLAHVEDSDEAGVLREGGEEVRVVRRCWRRYCQFGLSTFEVVFASSDVGCLPAMRNSGGGQELDGAEGLPLAGGLTTKISEPG